MGYLNLGSLFFGAVGIILPVYAMLYHKLFSNRQYGIYLSVLSLVLCMLAIYFQMVYQNYLIEINDLSALLDTNGAATLISGVLLVVTLAINVTSLYVNHRQKD